MKTHHRQAINDVRHCLAAVGLDVRRVRVRTGRMDDCWGFWAPSIGVVVHVDLRGEALYRILLHEFGHALGLDHTRTGLMRRYPLRGYERRADLPTGVQKKRWVMQLARAVLRQRARKPLSVE